MSILWQLDPVFENNPDYIRMLVKNPDDEYATIASMTSITYRVIEYASKDDAISDTNGTEILASTALTVATSIYDTLQSWAVDSVGYNFKFLSPATNRPNGGKWIRHQVTFTPTSGPAYMAATCNYVIAIND